jgi:hypothetical protein
MLSAVKRLEFVSYRVSFMVLRSRWCNIIVLNKHTPSEEKTDDWKDSFYEEVELIFCRIKILLGDFNAKVETVNIFKPTFGTESLYQDSKDNIKILFTNKCTLLLV